MRKKLILIGMLVLTVMLSGCSTKDKDKNETKQKEVNTDTEPTNTGDTQSQVTATNVPTVDATITGAVNESENKEVEDINLSPEEKIYQDMIKRSLMFEGNNYRIKKAIEKARNGEEVTLAYIGGSITEGAVATSNDKCYASLSYEAFKKAYGQGDGSNVKMINAGMGGTPSSLGVIRYKRDVLDKIENLPDIVFIEFSVNDYEEVTKGEAYESMIRNILSADNHPAVVLLFSVFQSRWNMQDNYRVLGKAYQLPMVSIKDAVVPALDVDKTLTEAEFFGDIYHPTDYGHQIMADCISYMFEVQDKAEFAAEDMKLSQFCYYGKSYEGIKMLDSKTIPGDVSLEIGGFTSVDNALVTLGYDRSRKTFPDNWMHAANNTNEAFKLKLNCKNMLLVYKLSSSSTAGKAEVYVDGKLVQTLDSFSSGGWNNPSVAIVFNKETAAMHTVEIKMASGDEGKEFSILAVGYTQ